MIEAVLDFLSSHAGLLGLLFFFIFFLGAAAWTFRPGAASGYKKQALIPFEEMD